MLERIHSLLITSKVTTEPAIASKTNPFHQVKRLEVSGIFHLTRFTFDTYIRLQPFILTHGLLQDKLVKHGTDPPNRIYSLAPPVVIGENKGVSGCFTHGGNLRQPLPELLLFIRVVIPFPGFIMLPPFGGIPPMEADIAYVTGDFGYRRQ
jgi:hypothetical protein